MAKRLVSKINSSYFERFLVLSLLREQFSELKDTPNFSNREDLWENVFQLIENKSLSVIELGVWKGYSMRKFAKLNTNPGSKFYGFDSFEGLPEYWKRNNLKANLILKEKLQLLVMNEYHFSKAGFKIRYPLL